jgi:hypothetical protein
VYYVARSVLVAEHETQRGLVQAIHCLTQGADAMSRYQYLAHLTEIATEIAQAKKIPADEIFETLASLPRERVVEHVKKIVNGRM